MAVQYKHCHELLPICVEDFHVVYKVALYTTAHVASVDQQEHQTCYKVLIVNLYSVIKKSSQLLVLARIDRLVPDPVCVFFNFFNNI